MIRCRLGCAALIASLAFIACSREARSYDGLPSLAEAVSDAGVSCGSIKAGRKAELVSASGSCADSEVMLYMFDSAQALESWTKVGARLGPTAVGPNWAATGEANTIETVANELEAELVSPQDP